MKTTRDYFIKFRNQELCEAVEMFLTRSEYDRGVNTFSPEGRIFQVRRMRIMPIWLDLKSKGIKIINGNSFI